MYLNWVLPCAVVGYVLAGIMITRIMYFHVRPIGKAIIRGALIMAMTPAMINTITWLVGATAEAPLMAPQEAAASFDLRSGENQPLAFAELLTIVDEPPMFLINPKQPWSIDGKLIISHYGRRGITVFEIPWSTVTPLQNDGPALLSVTLSRIPTYGRQQIVSDSGWSTSITNGVLWCDRHQTHATVLDEQTLHDGLRPIVEGAVSGVTMRLPWNMYRTIREMKPAG